MHRTRASAAAGLMYSNAELNGVTGVLEVLWDCGFSLSTGKSAM
jgi:hypothetical protein